MESVYNNDNTINHDVINQYNTIPSSFLILPSIVICKYHSWFFRGNFQILQS